MLHGRTGVADGLVDDLPAGLITPLAGRVIASPEATEPALVEDASMLDGLAAGFAAGLVNGSVPLPTFVVLDETPAGSVLSLKATPCRAMMADLVSLKAASLASASASTNLADARACTAPVGEAATVRCVDGFAMCTQS